MKDVAEGAEGSKEGGVPQREGSSRWSGGKWGRRGGIGAVVVPTGGVGSGGGEGFVLSGVSRGVLGSGFFWNQRYGEGVFGNSGFIVVIEVVSAVVVVVECVQRRVNGVLRSNGGNRTWLSLYDLVLLSSNQKSWYTLCFRSIRYLPPSAYHSYTHPSTPALH